MNIQVLCIHCQYNQQRLAPEGYANHPRCFAFRGVFVSSDFSLDHQKHFMGEGLTGMSLKVNIRL